MARINVDQLWKVANFLKNHETEYKPFNCYSIEISGEEVHLSSEYPELDHPHAIDFLFFAALHDYGFWFGDRKGYAEPIYGTVNGKRLKGANLMFAAIKKYFDVAPESLKPEALARISPETIVGEIFTDDNGPIPFPDMEERIIRTQAFGHSVERLVLSNRSMRCFYTENDGNVLQAILDHVNASDEPLKRFLSLSKQIAGFDEDVLLKRNTLLALFLANRPERFLKVSDPENWQPVIDYHIMRIMLRLGVVELGSEEDIADNENRRWVSVEKEREIRSVVYQANEQLLELTGMPLPELDLMLWMARKYCPEMTEPECEKCMFVDVCQKNTSLFQPIRRTTDY